AGTKSHRVSNENRSAAWSNDRCRRLLRPSEACRDITPGYSPGRLAWALPRRLVKSAQGSAAPAPQDRSIQKTRWRFPCLRHKFQTARSGTAHQAFVLKAAKCLLENRTE